MASTPNRRCTEAAAAGPAARPAWAEVDLDALAANLARLRAPAAPAGVLAVVKADAYGHGAPAVAPALERAGAEWLGVALLEEGAALRRAGAGLPILVLGTAHEGQLPLYRRYRLTPTVSSLDQLEMWRAWARRAGGNRGPLAIHLEIDTGMHRLGVPASAAAEALARVRAEPRLALAGLMSHFADADQPPSPANPEQARRFAAVVELLDAGERERVLVHMANSAAVLHLAALLEVPVRRRLCRLGLALYGLDPAGPGGAAAAGLVPVLSVAGRIVLVRRVEAGGAVGYGGLWRAERPSEVAVVPVGYGDGYPWRLSGRAEALLGGRRVPVVGAVNMDMTAIDVTGTGAAAGDRVVLLGRDGGDEIGGWELAERAGTTPYELLCGFGRRLPRRPVGGSGGGAGDGSRLGAEGR